MIRKEKGHGFSRVLSVGPLSGMRDLSDDGCLVAYMYYKLQEFYVARSCSVIARAASAGPF
jgi:hypothetical protein